jgi:hypothetical protein
VKANVLAHFWGVFFMFGSICQKVCFLARPVYADDSISPRINISNKRATRSLHWIFGMTFLSNSESADVALPVSLIASILELTQYPLVLIP